MEMLLKNWNAFGTVHKNAVQKQDINLPPEEGLDAQQGRNIMKEYTTLGNNWKIRLTS